MENLTADHQQELEKLNKILKTLEEELANKLDKIKQYDARFSSIDNEKKKFESKFKDLTKAYEKLKNECYKNPQQSTFNFN